MYKIKFYIVFFFCFFITIVFCSLFVFLMQENKIANNFSMVKSNDLKKQFNLNYYKFNNYLIDYLSTKKYKENFYDNKIITSLAKFYLDHKKNTKFEIFEGKKDLFFDKKNINKKILNRLKENPKKIIFNTHNFENNRLLYFFYMEKRSSDFIYIGSIDILRLKNMLIPNYDVFEKYDANRYFIVNDKTILSSTNSSDKILKNVVQFFSAKFSGSVKDIEIENKKNVYNYASIFIPSESLWLLVVSEVEKNIYFIGFYFL